MIRECQLFFNEPKMVNSQERKKNLNSQILCLPPTHVHSRYFVNDVSTRVHHQFALLVGCQEVHSVAYSECMTEEQIRMPQILVVMRWESEKFRESSQAFVQPPLVEIENYSEHLKDQKQIIYHKV